MQSRPRAADSGDCQLASCCRGKGHESRQSCGFNGSCGLFRGRGRQPEYRRQKLHSEESRKAALAKRVPILRKWLWILFWLIIPSTLAAILTNETVVQALPGLYIPGQIWTLHVH